MSNGYEDSSDQKDFKTKWKQMIDEWDGHSSFSLEIIIYEIQRRKKALEYEEYERNRPEDCGRVFGDDTSCDCGGCGACDNDDCGFKAARYKRNGNCNCKKHNSK